MLRHLVTPRPLVSLLLTSTIAAQGPQVFGSTWGGSGDEFVFGARVDPTTGNLVAAGGTTSFGRNEDFLLVQWTTAGALVAGGITSWGAAGDDSMSGALLQTGVAPGFYLYGDSDSFSPFNNDMDIVLLKYPLGPPAAPQWAVRWASAGNHDEHADVMFAGPGGTAYFAGGIWVTPGQLEDVLLLKLALPVTGAPTTTQAVVTWGGNDDDSVNSGAVDNSSGAPQIVVAGNTKSFGVAASIGTYNVLLQKYDANFGLLWTRAWGGANDEDAFGMTLDAQGNIFVVGVVTPTISAPNDALIMKWDANGNLLWHVIIGGAGGDEVGGVQVDCAGNLLVSGQTSSVGAGQEDGLLLKLDTNGNLLWAATWGGPGSDGFGEATVLGCGDLIVPGAATGTAFSGLQPWTTAGFTRSTSTALVGPLNPSGVLGTPAGSITACSATSPAASGGPVGLDAVLLRLVGAAWSLAPGCPAAATSGGGPVLGFDNTPVIGRPFVIRRTATSVGPVATVLMIGLQVPALPLSNFGSTVPGAALCINPVVTQFFLGGTSTLNPITIPPALQFCGVNFDVQWLDAPTLTEIGSSAVGHFVVGL